MQRLVLKIAMLVLCSTSIMCHNILTTWGNNNYGKLGRSSAQGFDCNPTIMDVFTQSSPFDKDSITEYTAGQNHSVLLTSKH